MHGYRLGSSLVNSFVLYSPKFMSGNTAKPYNSKPNIFLLVCSCGILRVFQKAPLFPFHPSRPRDKISNFVSRVFPTEILKNCEKHLIDFPRSLITKVTSAWPGLLIWLCSWSQRCVYQRATTQIGTVVPNPPHPSSFTEFCAVFQRWVSGSWAGCW